jgi:hypothetical protein
MPLRIALVIGACAAIVFGASRLRDEHRCTSARQAIITALFHHRIPEGGFAHQQSRLIDGCRDGSILALVSTVETTAGLRGPATTLARRVTREEPRNRVGWIALAQALERSDPRGAAAARARAHALDPRGRIPGAAGAGAGRPGA